MFIQVLLQFKPYFNTLTSDLPSGGTTRDAHVRVVGAGRRRRGGAGVVAAESRAEVTARRC